MNIDIALTLHADSWVAEPIPPNRCVWYSEDILAPIGPGRNHTFLQAGHPTTIRIGASGLRPIPNQAIAVKPRNDNGRLHLTLMAFDELRHRDHDGHSAGADVLQLRATLEEDAWLVEPGQGNGYTWRPLDVGPIADGNNIWIRLRQATTFSIGGPRRAVQRAIIVKPLVNNGCLTLILRAVDPSAYP